MFFRLSYSNAWCGLDLTNFYTGKVTNMTRMFEWASRGDGNPWTIGDISGWDVSKVEDMSYMFNSAGKGAGSWTVGDISNWDTGSVTNMAYMFIEAGYSAATWSLGDIGKWNVSNVQDMSHMFTNAGYNATNWNIGNLGYVDADHPGWDTGNVTTMASMFEGVNCKDIDWTIGNIGSWNVSKVESMASMFKNAATANNMNAYTAISGGQNMTPQYDDNGNMTSDGTHTYQYNYNNRLTSVDNGQTATYKYDALNRRIQKVVVEPVETTTNYYYCGDQAIEERNANNAVQATYIFGISVDDVLQMQRGSNTYYYHKNHLGSVMALTDGSGNLVERYEYDPYGQPSFFGANDNALSQSAVGNAILFTGRDYDAETGLYYYRARTMHPGLGRFMQHDPLMYVDGMGLYHYVGDMPTRMLDSWGTNILDSINDILGIPGEIVDLIEEYQSWEPTDWAKMFKPGLDGGYFNNIWALQDFNKTKLGKGLTVFKWFMVGTDIGHAFNTYKNTGISWESAKATWDVAADFIPIIAKVDLTFRAGFFIGSLINGSKVFGLLGGKTVEDFIFDNITDPLISLPGKIKNKHESIKNDVCTAAQGWSNIFERNAARKKNGNDDSAWLLCKYAGVCNY